MPKKSKKSFALNKKTKAEIKKVVLKRIIKRIYDKTDPNKEQFDLVSREITNTQSQIQNLHELVERVAKQIDSLDRKMDFDKFLDQNFKEQNQIGKLEPEEHTNTLADIMKSSPIINDHKHAVSGKIAEYEQANTQHNLYKAAVKELLHAATPSIEEISKRILEGKETLFRQSVNPTNNGEYSFGKSESEGVVDSNERISISPIGEKTLKNLNTSRGEAQRNECFSARRALLNQLGVNIPKQTVNEQVSSNKELASLVAERVKRDWSLYEVQRMQQDMQTHEQQKQQIEDSKNMSPDQKHRDVNVSNSELNNNLFSLVEKYNDYTRRLNNLLKVCGKLHCVDHLPTEVILKPSLIAKNDQERLENMELVRNMEHVSAFNKLANWVEKLFPMKDYVSPDSVINAFFNNCVRVFTCSSEGVDISNSITHFHKLYTEKLITVSGLQYMDAFRVIAEVLWSIRQGNLTEPLSFEELKKRACVTDVPKPESDLPETSKGPMANTPEKHEGFNNRMKKWNTVEERNASEHDHNERLKAHLSSKVTAQEMALLFPENQFELSEDKQAEILSALKDPKNWTRVTAADIPTGNKNLDAFLQGGIPVGTMCIMSSSQKPKEDSGTDKLFKKTVKDVVIFDATKHKFKQKLRMDAETKSAFEEFVTKVNNHLFVYGENRSDLNMYMNNLPVHETVTRALRVSLSDPKSLIKFDHAKYDGHCKITANVTFNDEKVFQEYENGNLEFLIRATHYNDSKNAVRNSFSIREVITVDYNFKVENKTDIQIGEQVSSKMVFPDVTVIDFTTYNFDVRVDRTEQTLKAIQDFVNKSIPGISTVNGSVEFTNIRFVDNTKLVADLLFKSKSLRDSYVQGDLNFLIACTLRFADGASVNARYGKYIHEIVQIHGFEYKTVKP